MISAERRSLVDPQDVGVGERVADEGLQSGPGHTEACAGDHGQELRLVHLRLAEEVVEHGAAELAADHHRLRQILLQGTRLSLATVVPIVVCLHSAPGTTFELAVMLDDRDIYGRGVSAIGVRRMIGMVFQRPNPFPTMSIYDNVLAGNRLNSKKMSKQTADDTVEKALRESGVPVIELRASVILGSGSLSFEMIAALVERLPVMICPRWVDTLTQPIAIADLAAESIYPP